ncbi:MAG: tyrosine-type recombinase/integrase, partial [Alphaproteobacteria bacterium]|nr:tyrosine-type recombinase/integrase [Alphaproteobacteria bacterium]
KNTNVRTIRLHPGVIEVLAEIDHQQQEVFRRPDGMPYERPLPGQLEDTSGGSRIRTAFKGACRRAGIKDFRPHDTRHDWATMHYKLNKDLLLLQRHGGWKSERMVTRYAHLTDTENEEAIDNLPWGKSGDFKTPKPKTVRTSIT